MRFKTLFFAICCFVGAALLAQNNADFFRTLPNINEKTPEWAILMYSSNPNVPEVVDAYNAYYANIPFKKDVHTQNFKYWIRAVKSLLNNEGYIILPDEHTQEIRMAEMRNRYNLRNSIHQVAGADLAWVSMGPFETFKANTTQAISWHTNIYSFDQSISNPDIAIAGSEAGGVFRTTDRGQNWSLVTKHEVFAGGNSAVKIHPSNEDVMLISSNSRIYRSDDGGVSWNEQYFTNGSGNEFKFHPTANDTVFHTSSAGLFRSNDAGITWVQIYSDYCRDVDFHPTDFNIIYLLKDNDVAKKSEFYRSDDGGATWVLKDTGYYIPSDLPNANIGGGKIAVSVATPNMVYVALIGNSKAGDDGWVGVYVSEDMGENWTNPSGQDGGPYAAINSTSVWNVAAYSGGYHQGFYNFDLEASQEEPGKIWIATIRLTESSDSAKTFVSIGSANSVRLNDIHADVQDLEVNGSDIWVISDGGINYSNDSLYSHVALNKGISSADFWGFNTGWNEDTYTGGKYHDGTTGWFENYGLGRVHNIGGVEEATGYVHPIESRKMIFRTNYASTNSQVKTIPLTLGGNLLIHSAMPLHANESYSNGRSSGVFYDPRYANHVFIGRDNKIYKSTDAGANFDVLYTFPDANGLVYEIEISRANPDVMYCIYNPGGGFWDWTEVQKSTDGGVTWAKTLTDPATTRREMYLSINPENENDLWLTSGNGANGAKVFHSSNGGDVWMNITTNVLDGEETRDILYQGGTNDLVYVATNFSVYYWDATINNWIDYSIGLPLAVKSLRLNPFYRDAELRLGTYGRGVFAREMENTDFLPVAQPITYADSLFCTRDTVKFDCYSILKHEGASWNWSFNPAPIYISSVSDRNPKVVFGGNGSYDVTLTVTDGNGNSNSKTIQDMISVDNNCEVDTVPSMSLSMADDEDYFVSADAYLTNVTHFTASAWMKPNPGQNGYAGIVSNGAWCAHCTTGTIGLTINYWGDRLWYRWPGTSDSWAGNSGLYFNENEWNYVALTVTPTTITLYLNDEKWVSNMDAPLAPVDINDLYVGYGHYNAGLVGELDEVAVWTRALSEAEIRELRHLTKDKIVDTDPNLVAYYQFNGLMKDGKTILDNGGLNHGILEGGAALEISTAPIGAGVSERQTIFTGGVKSYSIPGVDITFPAIGTFPNGEVVVSRINLPPDSLPNNNIMLDHYWIINNYGTNKTFDELEEIAFIARNGEPSLTAIADPNTVEMHKRSDNEHRNNWSLECLAAEVSSGENGQFSFDNTCGMTSFSQFQLTSNSPANELLPVELLTFNASKLGDRQVLLEWESASEINLQKYIVQRSLDGINFSFIGNVFPESPNSSSIQNYRFIDREPIAGLNYYRLQIEDLDASYDFSKIQSILMSTNKNEIKVYPNPVRDEVSLTVDLGTDKSGEMRLYDNSGKLVGVYFLRTNFNEIDARELKYGIYMYSIITDTKIRSGKLVVQ